MAIFWSLYLARPEDGDRPYGSPLKSDSFDRLPPTLILVAVHDALAVEAKAYYEALLKYSVKAIFKSYPGMIHDFINLPVDLASKRQALADINIFLTSLR